MPMISRALDASHINAILNHPEVRPWIANGGTETIDLTATIEDRRNVVLMGEHGGVAFLWMQPGIYECHTQVLPHARGEWTRQLTEACARYIFTKTDAYEVVTRVPAGHVAAKAAAEAQGMKLEFTRENGCVFRNKVRDVHLYSSRLQDWIPRASGLVERGKWLHERMEAEALRLGIDEPTHEDDENHNRYVGAAIEMALGGQLAKAVSFYNRWASMARHIQGGTLSHISLISVDPPVVRFDIGLMRLNGDDIEVIREC